MMRSNILLTMVTCLTVTDMYATESSDMTCRFAGSTYGVNESWHPLLQPFGIMHCINCTCTASGDVTCHSKKCPTVTCTDPVTLEGACCPSCDIDNIPPDTKDGDKKSTGGSRKKHKQCRHTGSTYQHGQVFPSSTTALKPTRDNQCVRCICLDGDVLCHLKSCPNLTCSEQVFGNDDCCPICADKENQNSSWGDYGDTFDFLNGGQSNGEGPECETVDGVHENGTSWNPVVGPFGRMNCVTCTCKTGQIQCDKIGCPRSRELPCRRPKSVPGQCCPICPADSKPKPSSEEEEKGLKPKKRKKVRPQKKSQSQKNNKKSRTSPKKSQTRGQSGSFFSVPCLPKKMDTVVRMADTGTAVSFLFENLKVGKVEMYNWPIFKGKAGSVRIEKLSNSRYAELLETHSTAYKIIGATKQKRIQRFKRKIQRIQNRCKDKCRKSAILKLSKQLNLKKIAFKSRC